MKLLMVGLGSIGRRHLRNITALLRERGIDFNIDALRSSQTPLPPKEAACLYREYDDIKALPENYDAAFICNPTSLHYDTIRVLVSKAKHMFIEKPVFDRWDYDISALGLRPEGQYYVACPLRYTSVLQRVKEYVQTTKIYAARAICSTYLPNWRPGEDYRKSYSAHAYMGGGVSIDLIHEWDYLCWLFGKPEKVINLRGQYSELNLDSDDLSVYLGQYPDKLISLHLDYFGRVERRELELYTAEDVIVGDLRKQEIRFLRAGKVISLPEDRDAYQRRELFCFFAMLDGRAKNQNTIRQAMKTVAIAHGGYLE